MCDAMRNERRWAFGSSAMILSSARLSFASERNALISRVSVTSPGLTKSSACPVRTASATWPKRSVKENAVGFWPARKRSAILPMRPAETGAFFLILSRAKLKTVV